MTMKPYAVRCAWKGCLTGKPGKFTPFLRVWSVKHDPVDHPKSFNSFELKGQLFCEWCAHNRRADALLRQYPKLWATIRRAFHEKGMAEPNPDTVDVRYRGEVQIQLPHLKVPQ